jgi:hypothetical protein
VVPPIISIIILLIRKINQNRQKKSQNWRKIAKVPKIGSKWLFALFRAVCDPNVPINALTDNIFFLQS